MPKTLAEKIIQEHLLEGEMVAGKPITLKVDQALLQDATGTMACLQFEALGVEKIKTDFGIAYVDHNMIQADEKNADDHLFLQTFADKYGLYFSKPGNGICHHVHTERFTKPGQILLGADSHTPTAASGGMLGIGAGGLDVAVAMATQRYDVKMPAILGIKLTGRLQDWCAPKDVILEILRKIGEKGGVGKVLEYFGPGVKTLQAPERATIGNMGAETGATSSIFPSDENTLSFFKAEGREKDWKPLAADEGAEYSDVIEINLDEVIPLAAVNHSPGEVVPVKEIEGTPIRQSMVGSSCNSSYKDLMLAAKVLEGTIVSNQVFFHVIPGSRQALETIEREGGLRMLLRAGARIAEPSCNACIGMGNAPPSNSVSIRSFPRNWEGRSGTRDDDVVLASPETCVASALKGVITDPRNLGIPYPKIEWPTNYVIDDALILKPTFKSQVIKGPNIKSLPDFKPLADTLEGEVLIHLEDNISTDHIMPAGAEVLPYRSNIPAISQFVFRFKDPEFPQRAKEKGGGFIVGGDNYGQGSSREHAALAPMYLGVKAVLVKSFARIHKANLINFGIVPLEFENGNGYEEAVKGSKIKIEHMRSKIEKNEPIEVEINGKKIRVKCEISQKDRKVLLAGGTLNYVKSKIAA